MAHFLLLAQGQGPASILQSPMIPLLLIGMVFYFMLLRPERQRRAKHTVLLSNLKKNDRIVTSGGIFGTIVNVHKGDGEDDSVVIKIDESTGAKIRIQRNSISRVLTTNQKSGTVEQEKAGAV